MSDITIKTNHHPRDILRGYELTPAERAEFDYIDTSELRSWDEAEFVRYRGDLIDINDTEGRPAFAPGWDAYRSDSFFSGIVLRFPMIEPANRYHDAEYDYERVIVGTYYAS